MCAEAVRAKQLFDAAEEAAEREEFARAVADATAAVALDPTPARWHYRLGLWRERIGDWAGAVVALEAAVALAPGRAPWLARLGRARARRWDLTGAVEAYARAVSLAPQRESWARRREELRQEAETFRPYDGMIIAHRGRSGGRPGNVIESLDQLPAYVAGVEVDVRLTRDGVPVLMHDPTVETTTDGSGELARLPYAQVSGLRGPAGTSVPALSDYLDACAGRGFRRVLVDVKAPDHATLTAVAEVVGASPVADLCVVLMRSESAMADLRRADPTIRMGGLGVTVDNQEELVAAARKWGAEMLFVAHGGRRYLEHRDVVAMIRRHGLQAGASTVNGRRALEAARTDGCDLILTDVSEQLPCFVGADRDGY